MTEDERRLLLTVAAWMYEMEHGLHYTNRRMSAERRAEHEAALEGLRLLIEAVREGREGNAHIAH